MALYRGAKYRPLATKQTQPAMRAHDIVCLHTMVGYLGSTDAMFKANGYGGTESHFGIGGRWGQDVGKELDGVVYQWQDTTFTADANLDGRWRVISIETADNAPRFAADLLPWTPKQIEAIIRLVAWACQRYNIPVALIPDTRPGRRGIGYHRQGCEHSDGVGTRAGFLVSGGERWSKAIGKECPGPRRIAQIKSVIIPGVKALIAQEKEDADMPTVAEIVAALKPVIRAEAKAAVVDALRTAEIIPNKPIDPPAPGTTPPPLTYWTPAGVLAASDQKADLTGRDARVTRDDVAEIKLNVAALMDRVPPLPPAPAVTPPVT
jgi:hypothetical protein